VEEATREEETDRCDIGTYPGFANNSPTAQDEDNVPWNEKGRND
jgi:hypothetical protein